jgi:hypothetical protein
MLTINVSRAIAMAYHFQSPFAGQACLAILDLPLAAVTWLAVISFVALQTHAAVTCTPKYYTLTSCGPASVSGGSVDYYCECQGSNDNSSAVMFDYEFATNPGEAYIVYRTITTNSTTVNYNISYTLNGKQAFWEGENAASLDAMAEVDIVRSQMDAYFISADNASATMRFGYFSCATDATQVTPQSILPGSNPVQVCMGGLETLL